MARLFDDATSEYLDTTTMPVTAAPFTFACWAYPDATGIFQAPGSINDSASHTVMWNMTFIDTNILRFRANGGANADADTSNTVNLNAWNHVFCSTTGAASRTVILNGDTANKGTNTTSQSPAGVNRFSIGRTGDLSPSNYFSGRIAEVAVWDAGLTDAEGVLLNEGVSPLNVRPGSLVFYAPLYRDEDEDFVGGISLSAFNTPSVADHPPVMRPLAPVIPIAATSDSTAPVLSSPTGAATGQTTAVGSVSTDEGNGTLYWICDQSGTAPSVAQIQAGQGSDSIAADDSGNQAVSATGVQNVSATGLSASTTYYFHYQHRDAATNDSTVVSSGAFATNGTESLGMVQDFIRDSMRNSIRNSSR